MQVFKDQKFFGYLQDRDGSTRDINFTAASRENVATFLTSFLLEYSEGELNDQEGEVVEMNVSSVMKILENKTGTVHGQLKAKEAIIGQVHLFIDWPEESGFAIEISFFPQDLREELRLEQFLSQLNEWWDLLNSREVFVRYENASWDWYNPKDLGVFYHAVRP